MKISSTDSPDIQFSEGVFYCQIDNYKATKDYLRKGRCVRFIGVTANQFSKEYFDEGVTTFVIDVDYWEFCAKVLDVKHGRYFTKQACENIDLTIESPEHRHTWFRIEVDFCEHGTGYIYPAFSEEKERYIEFKSISSVPISYINQRFCLLEKKPLRVRPTFLTSMVPINKPSILQRNYYVFETFHVGQGMCSLIHNGVRGVLLDVGAGKPVTRKAYLDGSIDNDLKASVCHLQSLDLIISHLDSDHWRILGWDSFLQHKIQSIYVPSRTNSLPLKDKKIKNKVIPLNNKTWKLFTNTYLSVFRSQPVLPDSNGDCLVIVFEKNGNRILAPGDYVYGRLRSDANGKINTLHMHQYAAVIVPHHGDAASANNIVPAAKTARAFFSAGTHQGYGHPTTISIDAHRDAQYAEIVNNTLPHIRKIRFL